jgi:cytochrome P450
MTDEMTDDPAAAAEAAARAFHLYSQTIENPHRTYAEFRKYCPVAKSDLFGGFYVLTRYEDVRRALLDWENLSNEQQVIPAVDLPFGRYFELYDPPDHAEYRKDLNAPFSPRAIAKFKSRMDENVRGHLGRVVENGGGDLVAEVCVQHPTEMFLLVLGADMRDAPRMLEWKNRIFRDGYSGDPERVKYVTEVVRPQIADYWREQLEQREKDSNPPDDVITHVSRAHKGDRPFTREEQIINLSFFMQAGLDSVTSTMSWTLLHLAQNPRHRRQLRENPSLIATAVEEFLRFYGPIGALTRKCKGRHVVGDTVIEDGDQVQLALPSANRDEDVFEAPEEVRLDRSPNAHFAFGGGPHRCLGSHLARAELTALLGAVIEVMPEFELAQPDEEPPRHWGAVFGVDCLQVVVPARS